MAALDRSSIKTTTRGELLERAGRLGAGLSIAGLERGDRVVIMAPNSADWIASAMGVMNAGGVLVPLDVQMPGEDLAHALADCDPGFLFTTPALRERIDALDLDLQGRIYLLDDEVKDGEAWSSRLAAALFHGLLGLSTAARRWPGWEVASGYGLNETSPILTLNPPDRLRLESAGIPLPGVELRIDARDGPGEVLVRGPRGRASRTH